MKRKAAALIAVTVAAVCVLAAVAWFWNVAYRDRSFPQVPTDVVVPRGETSGQVADVLQSRGVVPNALAFRLLVRLRGLDRDLQAGEYLFGPHESLDEILEKLTLGQARVATWVTIPEGYTAAQIARDLAAHNLGSAAAYREYFDDRSIEVGGVRTKNLEGYLFPSTYLFPLHATPEQTAGILVAQFRKELPPDAQAQARKLGYTLPQIVTIASLVEREAKADVERPRIASVIYNRLRKGIPLQVDASIEYALPRHETELTRQDLAIASPYNTYRHVGLPPTPIANPGLPSLLAALHPDRTDYYYYVYKGNGLHAFARTLQEHNANVSRYLR